MAELQCEYSAAGKIPVNVAVPTSFGVGMLLMFGFAVMASLMLFDGKGRNWCLRSISFLGQGTAARLDIPVTEVLLLLVYAAGTLFPVAYSAMQSGKLQNVAKTLGTVTQINLAIVILPATRTSLWITLFGLPYDRAVLYHRWLAWYGVAGMWAHFVCYLAAAGACILNNSVGNNPPLYGVAAVALFTAASLCALEPVRRKFFELFRVAHLAYVIAFVLVILHSTSMVVYLAVPVGLYVLDWVLRLRRWSQQWSVQSVSTCGPITILTLQAPSGFTFEAGQYCFVQVPSVSRNQWHPFSIVSAPPGAVSSDDSRFNVTFAMKSAGKDTWTGDLNAMIGNWNGYGNLEVRVDGPLGGLGSGVAEYKRVVLIAGGIGATPLLSILNNARHAHEGESEVVEVMLVWVVRGISECSWAAPLLVSPVSCPTSESSGNPRVKSSVFVFVTGTVDPEIAGTLPSTIQVSHGRPNLASQFKALALTRSTTLSDSSTSSTTTTSSPSQVAVSADDTVVIACGPQALVTTAHREAILNGFAFKSESFLF
jgi:predicted ferric reductase